MDRSIIDKAPALKHHYDAVVVGSGAGGSSLAYRLSQAGWNILLVERGDYLQTMVRPNSHQVGEYLGRVIGKPGDPIFCVGGQTKFYGSALYRLRERDFRATAHASGVSPAWPISYADLEPYYERAEILYRVHGSSGGDPSAPPRANPFPHPPIPHHPLVAEVIARLERSGTTTSTIPRGLDYGPGGRCILCPTCDAHYCRLDAKMDAETAALRPALATGRVQLLTRTECLRVLTDARGVRAAGVLLSRSGVEQVIHSDVVAVCAGVPESAVLLRRSRTDRHPRGLGNEGGALGRYLGGHSVGQLFPLVSWRRAMPPLHSKTFAINVFHDGAPEWPYPLGIIQVAGQMPFWEHASPFVRPIAHFVGTHCLTCFYAVEAIATDESGLIFDDDTIVGRTPPSHDLKSFTMLRRLACSAFRRAGYPLLARQREPYLWQEIGTARLGTDPATSVTDPNCQVHGIQNLFVVDQSVLPSAGVVNTALTTIAIALRAGDYIARTSSGEKSGQQRAAKFIREASPIDKQQANQDY